MKLFKILKFGYSEKATKLKNLPLKIWCYSEASNFKRKIFFNFVFFLECPNLCSNICCWNRHHWYSQNWPPKIYQLIPIFYTPSKIFWWSNQKQSKEIIPSLSTHKFKLILMSKNYIFFILFLFFQISKPHEAVISKTVSVVDAAMVACDKIAYVQSGNLLMGIDNFSGSF